jgi:hypothetical protein
VQAEGMVGFFNACELSGAERFLIASLNAWDYVKSQLLDDVHGGFGAGTNRVSYWPEKTRLDCGNALNIIEGHV